MNLKKYTVVIHYEGAWNYTVEAADEETAKAIAESYFEDADMEELWDSIEWEVCDSWEEE